MSTRTYVYLLLLLTAVFYLGLTPSVAASYSVHTEPPFVSAPQNFSVGKVYFESDTSSADTHTSNLQKARYYFARAAVSDYAPPLAWYQLGRVNFVLGDTETAIDNFETQYARFGSEVTNVHYMLGLTYGERGRDTQDDILLQKAEEELETFLSFQPNGVWGWTDLAWIRFLQGNYEGMEIAAETGLQIDEDHPWLMNMYGLALLNLGKTDTAFTVLQEVQARVQELTLAEWKVAYPENNPAEYEKGMAEFKRAVAHNLALTRGTARELASITDRLAIFGDNMSPREGDGGYAIPACGHSNPSVNGVCGSANGSELTSAPSSSEVCSSGTVGESGTKGGSTLGVGSAVTGNRTDGWIWSCQGSNGGSSASCSADGLPIHGVCGSADGSTTHTSAPSGGERCDSGTPTALSGNRTGGWTWSCRGQYGGSNNSCSAVGMCSSAHYYQPARPSVQLDASFEDPHWGSAVRHAAPADQIRLQWSNSWSGGRNTSYSTRTCQLSGFSSNGEVVTVGDEMDLGESRVYSAQCSESLCNYNDRAIVRIGVVEPTILSFDANPDIIRSGGTTTISWELEADGRTSFPMDCSLVGATEYDFQAQIEPSGRVETGPLTNFFANRLRCTEPVTGSSLEAETEIEVVPGIQEL